jgi:hypothetical protein
MNWKSLLIIGFLGGILSLVAEINSERSKTVEEYISMVRRSLPSEASSFTNNLKSANMEEYTEKTLSLSRATEKAVRTAAAPRLKAALEGHQGSWAIVLNTFRQGDAKAKAAILKEWNESLSDSLPSVPQICALRAEWSRELLSERFWRVFKETQDHAIIQAVCFAVYENGGGEEQSHLEARLGTIESPTGKEIVQNALNWMKFLKIKDTVPAGPASAPPLRPY